MNNSNPLIDGSEDNLDQVVETESGSVVMLRRYVDETLYNLAFNQSFPISDVSFNDPAVMGKIPSTFNSNQDLNFTNIDFPPQPAFTQYNSSQKGNTTNDKIQIAQWMASEATKRGLPPELPVMCSLQESGLRNITYGDKDSVGFFQQRASWGSVSQRLNPAYSLDKFLTVAVQKQNKSRYHNGTSGYVTLATNFASLVSGTSVPTERAGYLSFWIQAVQVSRYPFAYAKHYDYARSLISGSINTKK